MKTKTMKTITWDAFVRLCKHYSLIDDNSGILLTPDFLIDSNLMGGDEGRMNIVQNDDNGSYHYATLAATENKTIEVIGCSVLVTEPSGKVFSLAFIKTIDDPADEANGLE